MENKGLPAFEACATVRLGHLWFTGKWLAKQPVDDVDRALVCIAIRRKPDGVIRSHTAVLEEITTIDILNNLELNEFEYDFKFEYDKN